MKNLLITISVVIAGFNCKAQLNENNIHFRLSETSNIKYVIDIDYNKKSNYDGSILLSTKEYVDYADEKQTNRHYQEKFNLDSLEAHKIIQLYHSLNIGQIKEWEPGLDGSTYTIEYTDSHVNIHNEYWSPDAIKTKEARLIQLFLDSVGTIINLKHHRAEFSHRVPFECYNEDSSDVTCKILTEEQKRKYKAERDAYRKAHPVN